MYANTKILTTGHCLKLQTQDLNEMKNKMSATQNVMYSPNTKRLFAVSNNTYIIPYNL